MNNLNEVNRVTVVLALKHVLKYLAELGLRCPVITEANLKDALHVPPVSAVIYPDQ